jgi:twitching motility protein PilT
MPLVDSLLTAIVRSDGDALVLHVGEKPYVVAATGTVELSRQGLGLGAMEGLLAQLLPAEALRGLREMGAVEHELAASPAGGADRFTVVAARGGDDIWIEVRRHRRVRPVTAAVRDLSADAPATSAAHPVAGPASAGADLPPARDVEPVVQVAVGEAVAAADAAQIPAALSADEDAATAAIDDRRSAVELQTPEAAPAIAETQPELAAAPPIPAEPFTVGDQPVPFARPVVAETPVAAVAPVAVPDESPAADAAPPAVELAPEVSIVEAWDAEHVPAIDFEQTLGETAELPPLEFTVDVPAVAAAPASFEAALLAGAVPSVEPLPEPVGPLVEAAAGIAPGIASAPEPVAVPVEAGVRESIPAAASVPAAPPPPATAPPVPPVPPASATMPNVPLVPEPSPAPPQAPAVEPYASRYDVPAAAVSPRAPMPRVEPTVSEPPVYRPIEPQPTLPGLPPSYEVDAAVAARGEATADALPGVVLSLTRDSARATSQSSRGHGRAGGIERLLRLAAARGASALYLTTQARPAVRVDGDIRLLEGEATLSSGDVEAAVLELAPEGARDKESAEWIRDLQDVGRVRITTFRDYRGPGALLRMISARATSAEQLGLVREIQALAMEPEGLVIVTGPRASGKSTLVSAYVDLINRQRNDYVITLEGQIRLVHESRGSLISQRELRGSASEVVAAARAALRENPDVLIIEDLRSPDVLQVALDAAGSGLLVFASVTAASATAALERLVDLCPSEQRRTVRAALAEHLRGVVAQVLLRKAGGGRLAARELVLNTNAVAALVSDGQIAQLPRAIDSGRKLGMAPLNDALVAFVQSGAVDVREAYRKADDKVGLLGLLRREGIDTSFVERLA